MSTKSGTIVMAARIRELCDDFPSMIAQAEAEGRDRGEKKQEGETMKKNLMNVVGGVSVDQLRANRGLRPDLRGDISPDLRGTISAHLTGDISGLTGDIGGLTGDISGLAGDISGLVGDISAHLTGDISCLVGDISGLTGDISDISCLVGDISGLVGDISGLRGNVTGVYGRCTGIVGDLDECVLFEEEREAGVDIASLVRGKEDEK